MHPRITHAKAVGPFQLALSFTDGSEGVADLTALIGGRGGVFVPLQDPDYFARVSVNTDWGTVEWPNGVDLDPDMMYDLATGQNTTG